MNPVDLIDVQATIAEGLATDSDYIDYSALVLDTVDSAFSGMITTEWNGRDTLEIEAARLRGAYTFHASAEMTDIVHGASQALLAQGQTFHLGFARETLPTENGFVMFEVTPGTDPLAVFDDSRDGPDWLVDAAGDRIRLPEMNVCGFSWGPVRGHARPGGGYEDQVGAGEVDGIRFTFYAPLEDHGQWVTRMMRRFNRRAKVQHGRNEQSIAEVLDEIGMTRERLEEITTTMSDGRREVRIPEGFTPDQLKLFMAAVDFVAEQRDISDVVGRADSIETRAKNLHWDPRLRRYRLIPALSFAFPRTSLELNTGSEIDADGLALLCFAWTFFHMCGQTIVVSGQERAPRAAARRWRDMPMPKMVTVVRLRRASVDSEHIGEGNVNWHHRWMVRGHWRMQACGPGRTERRPVWIAPFIKGPEGAPLIMTNKVYDLVR